MTIVLSGRAFLEEASAPLGLAALVADALAAGQGLTVMIGPDGVAIEETMAEALTLEGRWSVTHLAESVGYAAISSLAAPLFFHPVRVTLPFESLTTLKIGERPMANTIMRNLFNAGVRSEAFSLVRCAEGVNALSKALPRRYAWIVKHELADPALDGRYLADRLAVESHLATMPFERAVMAEAFAVLRGEATGPAAAADRFDRTRRAVMESMR